MRKLWISLILTVAVLNLVDAFLTLYGVDKGATEINPLMQFALDNGFFLEIKLLVSVTICLCSSKIDSLPVKIVIVIILVVYSLININHIILLKIL
jgi:hypothetical protein